MSKQVFCIPCAGGSASFFNSLSEELKGIIDIVPIELKGHGIRIDEPLCQSMREVAVDVTCSILNKGINGRFALLGYSMGTNICYEVEKILEYKFGYRPSHMFFCANNPPHINDEEENIHLFDDKSFIDKVAEYGGIPEEILSDAELMSLILPIMKTDFKIENEYKPNIVRCLPCDISICYGVDDMDLNHLEEWKRYTNKKCNFYEFSGNHFFINKKDNLARISKILRDF